MSEYHYITQANTFRDRLIREERVIKSTYQGLEVYKVNQEIRGRNGQLNSNDYFYTVSTIHTYTEGSISREALAAALKEEKKGICLHYTTGQISGDLPWLTGQISERENKKRDVSVPFMICHAGNIYQLSNPDTDLSWHLSPKYGTNTWKLHNQVIGIELCNFGHNLPQPNVSEEHIVTLPQLYRDKYSRFETFTDEQYIGLK